MKVIIIFLALGLGAAIGGIIEVLSSNWVISFAIGVGGAAFGFGVSVLVGRADSDSVGNTANVDDDERAGFRGVFLLAGFIGVVHLAEAGFIGIGVGVGVLVVAFGVLAAIVAAVIDVVDIGLINAGIIGLAISVVAAVVAAIGSVGFWVGVLFYLPSTLIYGVWGWPGFVSFWIAYMALCGLLIWDANRQQRRTQNPLHGLLDEQNVAATHPYRRMSLVSWLRFRRWRRWQG